MVDWNGLFVKLMKLMNKFWRHYFYLNWIWDVSLVYQDNANDGTYGFPDQVAFALGHNSILLHDWKQDIILEESHCEEKCILYSAHFIKGERPTWKSLTLYSGTVFNEVVIWKPVSRDKNKIIERIHAHDGVIFNMDFDFNSGLIVTASDDRSIRIWKCQSLQKYYTAANPLFTDIDPDSKNYLCKLYGHESRVWKAQCIKYCEKFYLISVGEDGQCIIWKLQISKGNIDGKIICKTRCHKGRNIWSLIIDQHKGWVATGGGDTGIRLWHINDLISNEVKITNHPFSTDRQDYGAMKSVHLCGTNDVIGHTDSGILLHFDIFEKSWTIINEEENFKSYSVMSVFTSAYNLVAIGNTKGTILLLHLSKDLHSSIDKLTFTLTSSGGKIHSLSWFELDEKIYLFVSGPSGELGCYNVKISNESSISCEQEYNWILPMAKHRWQMGVAMIKHNNLIYIVCGDRRGSLHLFREDICEPVNTIHGIHDKNGVTSVRRFGEVFISTGRDGIWRKIKINFKLNRLDILSQNRAAQGMDWLESVIPINDNTFRTTYAILGFHGRNFTAWSSETGDTLISIECGGGHRDWDFNIEDDKSVLVFIKESVLYSAQIPRDIIKETSVVEPYFHGGQITCIQYIDGYFDKISDVYVSYLASGSEDTRIYISAHVQHGTLTGSPKVSQLHRVFTIDDHISSVRALASVRVNPVEDDSSKTMLFSGGGRATINGYVIYVNKKLSWYESFSVEHIFSHNLNTRSKKNVSNVNPETRYMDLTTWQREDVVFVAAACSDAIIRIFEADVEQRKLLLTYQSLPYNHCFLTIEHFTVNKYTYIVSGATDGYLRIWKTCDFESTNHSVEKVFEIQQPCFEGKVHMSGINALHISNKFSSQVEDNTILIATGGDDNSINLNLITIKIDSFKVVSELNIAKAHSTQITGIRFLCNSDNSELELISTSIDQRLTKWRLHFHEELKYKFVKSVYTNISDISSLEIWSGSRDSKNLLYSVCGQGIQIFDENDI